MITSVPDADAALREAHDRVYRWPERFAGFRAELELDADGLVRRYPGLAERAA